MPPVSDLTPPDSDDGEHVDNGDIDAENKAVHNASNLVADLDALTEIQKFNRS